MPVSKLSFAGAALIFMTPLASGAALAGEGAKPAGAAASAAPTIDTNGDGKPDAWDLDGNGSADAWDTNGDGKPDAYDKDGDGKPDPAAPKP